MKHEDLAFQLIGERPGVTLVDDSLNLRCHPWAALAITAEDESCLAPLAAGLLDAIDKTLPAWCGWGIEYTN